ncbi:metallophosphoesterase [Acholeplasma hippikon]|uniref:Bis(5'-nucleosyl)-tetraphosphatase prpE [asymmetrical] n=1 Tax=Acholeplasma hippikon TaxID=264636 RepID=A0A449BJV6_9MOLU|nr:metallophosphoesterase [Acholeplasma hippikon]VEU82607.1 Bis(5'-nucleosyl)-tetraphosphatase prpE [asymmetrical] [Acholeplasma hippikon]
MKKYFVFSDIHGNFKVLVDALEKKGFEVDNPNHHLISLGDHFDRGVENLSVLGFLKYFDRVGRLMMILGNHDEFLLKFLKGEDDGVFNVKYNGMGNTLIELSDKEANSMPKIRQSILGKYPFILDLLSKMKDKIELNDKVFIHAGYTFSEEKGWYIYNFSKTPLFIENYPYDGKVYIFGHHHVQPLNKYYLHKESDEPFRYKHFIGIDANTVITKKVNILIFDEFGNEIT